MNGRLYLLALVVCKYFALSWSETYVHDATMDALNCEVGDTAFTLITFSIFVCAMSCDRKATCKSWVYSSTSNECYGCNHAYFRSSFSGNASTEYYRNVNVVFAYGVGAEVTVGTTQYQYCHCDADYFGRHCDSDLTTAIPVGARVIRGTDWKWGTQDNYGPGTISSLLGENGFVGVKWDIGGYKDEYRMGAEGAYDLIFI